MILVLGVSADQEHQARALLDSQQTQGSPDYHRWLIPEQFGQRFGPAPQDVQRVTGWLMQQGFRVNSVAKSARWIEFSGSAAQVQAAFRTEIHNYLVEGQLHTANASEVSIPAALAPVVRGVLSLHDFYSKPLTVRSPQKVTAKLVNGRPLFTSGKGLHALTPGDLATIYDLNPLYNATPTALNGTGQTIAIVAVSNINVSDVTNFRSVFGLPASNPNIILNGPDPGVVPGADEATLDVEWAGAAAPGATVDLVVSSGTLVADPVSLSALFIVDNNLAQVMNVSFGACETALGSAGNAFFQALWEQAAAQGISVFVSSGDQGAAGCAPKFSTTPAQPPAAVSGLSSTEFNTAVGGSEFNENVSPSVGPATFWSPTNGPDFASALGYIPEQIWNDSCTPTTPNSLCTGTNDFNFASGGGGISVVYGVPSWQTLSIAGLAGAGFTHRVLPDISLNAALHDPYLFCFGTSGSPECQNIGGIITFSAGGGTSFSSPVFAGIMAVINQKTKNEHPTLVAGDGRQGLANYVLYALGAAESGSALGFPGCNSSNQIVPTLRTSCAFNDITAGNNSVPNVTGFNASLGFDLASGLGSVDALNLATEWSSTAANFQGTSTTLSTTNITPISITHGMTVPFTASVARLAGTNTPTGLVSLTAQGGNLASSVGVTSAAISGSNGTATTQTVQVNNLPGGTNYTVAAFYPGDGTFAGSASNTISITVKPETSTTTLTPQIFNASTGQVTAGTTVAYGDALHLLALDAIVTGSSGLNGDSGQVTFSDGSAQVGTIPLDNSGTAELDDCFAPLSACLTPGSHVMTASYGGDSSFTASTNSVTITVTPGQPSLSLGAPAVAATGLAFTLSATVQTGLGTIPATGTIQFFDGTSALGPPQTVSNNQASMQVTLTASGNHIITAQYASNESNTYKNATSAAATVNVTAPFSFSAASTAQTILAGATATFAVTMTANGGFLGTVTLSCSGAPGGSTCTVSPNPAGFDPTTFMIPLTVTVSNTTNAGLGPRFVRSIPVVFAGVLIGLLCGVKKRRASALLLVLALALVAGSISCGGGSKPNTNATLILTGTSGSATNSITLNLTITH
jgi:subtilase family serine protease